MEIRTENFGSYNSPNSTTKFKSKLLLSGITGINFIIPYKVLSKSSDLLQLYDYIISKLLLLDQLNWYPLGSKY